MDLIGQVHVTAIRVSHVQFSGTTADAENRGWLNLCQDSGQR